MKTNKRQLRVVILNAISALERGTTPILRNRTGDAAPLIYNQLVAEMYGPVKSEKIDLTTIPL